MSKFESEGIEKKHRSQRGFIKKRNILRQFQQVTILVIDKNGSSSHIGLRMKKTATRIPRNTP